MTAKGLNFQFSSTWRSNSNRLCHSRSRSQGQSWRYIFCAKARLAMAVIANSIFRARRLHSGPRTRERA